MPQNVGTVSTTLQLDTRQALQQYNRFQQAISRNGGRNQNNALGAISANAKDIDSSLGKATNRVVAFGAAAAIFAGAARATREFAASIIDVEKNLVAININLGQSAEGLKKFGADLFNVARQTGQTFEVAAEAAAELARQGLGAEETNKRLYDSLVLVRVAGIGSAEAVEALTAAVNSFNKEALTSSEVVNKFVAVDTKFAVSSKDLAEAVSRVGSTAQSAGVGVDQLIGLVTSLQQTTSRGGSVIGNGLKTIFTRIQAAPETVSALQGIGVAIKNTDGSMRDALSVLKDYASARQKVGDAERAALDKTVSGGLQINILKALLGDLSKEYSIYGNAVQTSVGATDEAIQKNDQLNQTISALLNSTSVSIKQFFANIGDQKVGGVFREILGFVEKIRSFFSGGDTGEGIGKSLGEGILAGLGNVLGGPALVALAVVLIQAFKKVITVIASEARTLLSINSIVQARANTQKYIVDLLGQATQAERAQFAAASTVLAKKEQILAIEARINQERLAGNALTNSLVGRGPFGVGFRKSPKLGGNYLGETPIFADPINSAINREQAASGLSRKDIYVDRDPRVATFANPLGILVANKRDEPLGGFQGVNRVISQGGNPKTAGMGPISNFAKSPEELTLKLKQGGSLNKADLQILKESIRNDIVSKTFSKGPLSQFSNLSSNIIKQNQGLAKEIEDATEKQFVEIRKQNILNLTKRLKDSATSRIAKILEPRSNLLFSSSDADIAEVKKVIGRKLSTIERQVLKNYLPKIAEKRQQSIFKEDQNAFRNEDSLNASVLNFRNKQQQKAKDLAFQRATERISQGQPISLAQQRFVQEQLRNRALGASKQILPPNISTGARNSYIENSAVFEFQRLRAAGIESQKERNQAIRFSKLGIDPGTEFDSPIGPPTQKEARRQQLAGVVTRIGTRRRRAEADAIKKAQFRSNLALGGAFALPLLSGFIEPGAKALGINTGGGTTGGKVAGALSGAATFAGIGGIFGLPGLGAGAVIGGLIGAFGKLKKSTEEITAEFETGIAYRNQENDALSKAIQLQEDLRDAVKEGAAPRVIENIQNALSEARGNIRTSSGRAVLDIKDSKAQSTAEQANRELNDRATARDRVALFLQTNKAGIKDVFSPDEKRQSGNEDFAKTIADSLTANDAKSITPEQILALSKIAGGKFDVQKNVASIYQGPGSQPINLVTNAEEIKKAAEDFKEASAFIAPLAKLANIDASQITPDLINAVATALIRGVVSKKDSITKNEELKKLLEASSGRLSPNALLNAPNLDIFRTAAIAGRSPFANHGQKAQAQFDVFNELKSNDLIKDFELTDNKEYQSAKAGVQTKNLSDIIEARFGRGRSFRDSRGNPNLGALKEVLQFKSKGGGSDSPDAQILLQALEKLEKTRKDNLVDDKTPFLRADGTVGYPGSTGEFDKSRKRGGNLGSISGSTGYRTTANLGAKIVDTDSSAGEFGFGRRFETTESLNKKLEKQRKEQKFDLSKTPQDEKQKKDNDIDGNFQKVKEAAEAAKASLQAAVEVLQKSLNITVTIAGAGDPDTLAKIQASLQTLFNSQAKTNGVPNPPQTLSQSYKPLVPNNYVELRPSN